MKENYNVSMHITPELKVYIGVTSNDRGGRWKMASTYRGNIEFANSARQFGWENINHRIIEDGLTKSRATAIQRRLIESAGAQCLNTRNNTRQSLSKNLGIETLKNQGDMKKEKQQTAKSKAIGGVKVEMVLDTRFMHKDGRYPVCIRIYHQRKYKWIATGYTMDGAEFWDMNPKDEAQLGQLFDFYCEQVREGVKTGFDLSTLKKPNQCKTQGAATTLHGIVLEKGALVAAGGTKTNYKNTAKCILKHYPDGLDAKKINKESIGEYKDWLVRNGYTPATINIQLSIIRASVNYGIYKGYLKPEQYPFKRAAMEVDKVVIPQSGKRDENYLSKAEMQLVWEKFKETKNKKLGWFLFSYLHGGINLADMMYLRFTDFYFTEGGFVYKREKTKAKNNFKTVVPATKWTAELLDTMGITPVRGELVFKEMGCTKETYDKQKGKLATTINIYLGRQKWLNKHISFTTARHSFATVSTKEKMPYTMTEAAMGHALGGVSSHYIGRWDVAEMRQDFEKLL